jgi:hypothetical protein
LDEQKEMNIQKRRCPFETLSFYFMAIVSISINAPRGRSLTAKADLAG